MSFTIPTTIEIKGQSFAIRNMGDFRMVLDCFDALGDIELSKQERLFASLIIFYEDLNSIDDINKLPDIKTAVEQIKLGKVIKIPYIGNYAFNKLYLNLKEHHQELREFRKTVDINTYKDHVRKLVENTKKKLKEETKSELFWNKFKKKNNKKFYELARLHGLAYAKVWLYFHSCASVIPFDKDVQYMYDKLNEKS